jgi:AsmA protein
MAIAMDNFNPGRLIWEGKSDSIPQALDGLLSGSFALDLHFPHDTLQTLKKIDLREADLLFINSSDTIKTESLHILAENIYVDQEKDPNPFATLSADMKLGTDKSYYNDLSWVGYDFDVEARDGIYTVYPGKSRMFGKEGRGTYVLDPFSEPPNYRIKYMVEQYDVNDLMSNFMDDSLILGKMDLMIDANLVIPENQKVLKGLNGEISLSGKDLTLYGIELDKLIRRFERSQNFNLVDLGAVMFMGPVGLAVSKGGSYANIIVADYSANSRIRELKSQLLIENGRILLKDLAFSTQENRVAAKGWIDLPVDSLDATIAVVDKNGCSIIEQRVYGTSKEPQKSRIRFLETIIAPVTNLLQAAVGKDCEVFYKGSVAHPDKSE